jgi:transcriptional regulator with XRE-family HTH domain
MATTLDSGITRPIGDLLREWRERRRLSQLALALDAEVSTRHISFLETGRARPSREMLLRLTERLEVPLRERNTLLLAAGFAPAYPERDLDHPVLESARAVVDRVLIGHEPFPALAGRSILDHDRGQSRRPTAAQWGGVRSYCSRRSTSCG